MANRPTTQVPLTIYQWNCRSFKSKKAALELYVSQNPPDVIALQETDTPCPSLRGYDTYTNPPHQRTAIVIARSLTAQVIPITSPIDHVLVEILPHKPQAPSLYILNVYSPPTQPLSAIEALLSAAVRHTRNNPCLLLGDFNAPHVTWGYPHASKKGTALLQATQHHHFTLQNDLTLPTRLGTTVTRDTIPDLTFSRNATDLVWDLRPDTLGSDHYIIALTVPLMSIRRKTGTAQLTDWQAFREAPLPSILPTDNLEQWTQQLIGLQNSHTKTITLTQELPAVDNHLDHLWTARRSLLNRWRRNKHNRKLKRRIAQITEEALKYATQLQAQNWRGFCDQMNGTLTTKKAWHILRHLLGNTPTKTAISQNIARLMHNHSQPPDQLLSQIRHKLFGHASSLTTTSHPDYTGTPNPQLNGPFTKDELTQALTRLTRTTAPGHDLITYKLLRNLNDDHLESLLACYNHHWTNGTIPPQWRHADITLLPKPHKPITLDNLRPISLTSCVGKLFEHLVTRRLTDFLEDTNQLPHTMLGFRTHLSAQDVHLQLKERILDCLSKVHPSSVLALDIQGAFDNVTHTAILGQLQTTGCGSATYNYVRAFLTERTATLHIGPYQTETFHTPAKGTPQGSVVSPLLFNIALMGLPTLLEQIPHVSHALYADDLTIWSNTGSPGQQQDSLQQAIDTTLQYLQTCGLCCAPSKSALLVLRARTRGRPPNPTPDPSLSLNGQAIPTVKTLRILGVHYHHDGSGAAYLPKLIQTVSQLTHLIQRICSRRHGLKETDNCRILQAMLISRITYGAPYLTLKPQEHAKIDVLIRKSYKTALGLPTFTSTDRLLKLGLHNTLSEIIEAHLQNQLQRLQLTPAGRHLLKTLGRKVVQTPDSPQRIPPSMRRNIHVLPIPRHMHPTYNAGRRQHRTRLLIRKYGSDPTTLYTDASPYPQRPAHVATVARIDNAFLTSATVCTASTTTAEEAAIALAMTQATSPSITIMSDSQAACRRFALGRVSALTLAILTQCPTLPHARIVWTPSHTALPGNEVAHATARALLHRAFPEEANNAASIANSLTPLSQTYADILYHYRATRRTYPPPHPSLSTADARIWRRLQTNTYYNHLHLHHISPANYPLNCPQCDEPSTTAHLVWTCPTNPPPPRSPTLEQWECVLQSCQLEDQEALISRARMAAAARGLPE